MSSLVLANFSTAKVFAPSGGDFALTMTSLANGAGRVSAQWDRGATGPYPSIYQWKARTKAAVAPTVGVGVLNVYLIGGQNSSTMIPGKVGAADAAVASENLFLNAILIGQVIADVASNTVDFVNTGVIRDVRYRYISIGVFNNMGQALTGTAGDHEILMTAFSDEGQ